MTLHIPLHGFDCRSDGHQQSHALGLGTSIPIQQVSQQATGICLHDAKGTSVVGRNTGERGARIKRDFVAPTDEQCAESVNRLRGHLREAIDSSGIKHSTVARDIRVTDKHLSKMLARSGDQKPIGAHHIVRLPPAVYRAFIQRLATEAGLQDTFTVTGHVSRRLLGVAAGFFGAMDRYKDIA